MIAFGIVCFLAGAGMATQNTKSRISFPLMIGGIVLVIERLF